jgi:predicted aspartyl protease
MWSNALFYSTAVWLLMFPPDILRAAEGDDPSVPLLEAGNMIEVPVAAFHQTLYFVADTGFAISAMDARYAPHLGNLLTTYTAVSPLGNKKDVPIYQGPEMAMAGRPLALEKIALLDLKMLRLITGQPCDGVLGMDWFARNVVIIDFDHKTFTVAAGPPKNMGSTMVAVPLEPANGFYDVRARVNGDKMLDLMIDTGDSSSLSLNQQAWQEVFSTHQPKTVTATVADAVNQVAQTRIGVVGRVAIQGLQYTNLHAMHILSPDQPSRLGLGFFQRHRVTFDFARRRLYLQPGQHYSTPDLEDMSGLHLLRDGALTIVYSVDSGSPASALGIMANDTIETVNYQPAASLSMQAIRQIFRSGDGDAVVLQLRRDGRLLAVTLVLKKSL